MNELIAKKDNVEKALRESEETMRYIIWHDPSAIAVFDCNLHFMAVSERYLHDYNLRKDNVIGRHHYEIVPEMPQKWKEVHQRCLAGAIERKEEDFFERPDGSITYNSWECRPWYRINGEIGGIIIYTEVITERKLAERALKESEERYRYLFNHNPQPMWIYDLKTLAFLEVNDAAVNHYGYSRKEFMQMTLKDIRPAEDVPLLLEYIKYKETIQSLSDGIRHVKKNGQIIYVEITSHSVSFEGRDARHVLINDITERKLAEEKLQHVTRLYALLSQINQAIVQTKDPVDLYQKICRIAVEYGQFKMAWVGLIDEPNQRLMPVARAGFDYGYVDQVYITISKLPSGQGPCGRAAYSGEIVTSYDIAHDQQMIPWRDKALARGYYSMASVPFRCKGKTIGVLSLYSKEVGFFTSEEKQLLEKIGEDITYALDAMATENENRLAQEALINSEIHYRSLFESSKDGILIIDGESNRVTDVNPCLTHMSGYSKAYFLQNTLHENQFFKNISDIDYYLAEVKEKHYIHYDDVLLKTSEGRELYVELVSHTYLAENKKVIQCSLRDITERKLAEIKLKEALMEAQRFRQTLDYLSIHIYMKDLQSRYVYANKHTLEFFGCTEKELLGHDDSNIFSNKVLQKIKDNDRRVLTGEETNEEFDLVDMNGVRHVFWETKVPIYTTGENPAICGLLGISTDITERKLMEEKLGESEERFRELYDNAKIGMYRTTPEGSILMANKALIKMLGYSSFEELSRINLEDQNAEVFLKRNEFLERFTHADELIDWEATWVHVDGSDIYIRESARAIRDINGRILYFDGVVENITDRQRAMKALCESEAYLRTLVQTIPDLIWLKDVNGVFLKCNSMFAHYMGVSESELIGKTDYDFVEFERAEKFHQTDLKTLAEEKPTTFEEWYTFKNHDEPIFMETTKTPMFDSNGAVIGILGIGHNITHRKLAEKELIKAKEKAEESDRLKSSFLANMSHEVRTPLNSILGFSSLLADADFSKVQRDEFIHHIIKNGHNLLNIINDILDISKIETGEIKIFKSPVKAQEFISGIIDQFSYDSVGKDVEFKLSLPCEKEETIVIADKDRLYQVFCNLVSNAMKFTPSGHIEMGYQPKGDHVEFYVKDTGIGIPAEYHAKIFERFRQVETEKTRKYGGNGLGLAITKNLIELMDGTIWLNSEPGKGSAFHFTLPMQTERLKD